MGMGLYLLFAGALDAPVPALTAAILIALTIFRRATAPWPPDPETGLKPQRSLLATILYDRPRLQQLRSLNSPPVDDARAGALSDVDLLLSSLGSLPDPQERPTLLVLSGLPGSGKSFFCRKLTEILPVVVLETDALRKVLFEHPAHDGAENARLFRAIHRVLERLLSGEAMRCP